MLIPTSFRCRTGSLSVQHSQKLTLAKCTAVRCWPYEPESLKQQVGATSACGTHLTARVVLAEEGKEDKAWRWQGQLQLRRAGGRSGAARPRWVFPSSSDLWFLATLGRKGATPARGRVSVFSASASFWSLLPRMQILLALQKETLFRGLDFQFQFNSSQYCKVYSPLP